MHSHSSEKIVTQQDLFLKELRSATAQNHKKLEDTDLSRVIVSPSLTNDSYAAYLSRMYSLVKPFEDKIFPLLVNVFPDINNRKKSLLLEKDLSILGKNIGDTTIYNLDENVSEAYAVGCMYVLEGSTLGGKFISKNVATVLGYTADNGASYFSGYGADTGKMWQLFIQQLGNYGVNSNKQQEIFGGADDTFKLIYKVLCA